MSLHVRHKPLTEEQELVVRLRDETKLADDEIARQLGVSRFRVRQMYGEAQTQLKGFAEHGAESLFLLPKHARRFIRFYELGNRAQIRVAIESGRLRWDGERGRLFLGEISPRQFGWSIWVVLHEWAGLPAPKRIMGQGVKMHARPKPLNERQELVMRLRGEEKLSPAEVAQRMGIPKYQSAALYSQAKKRLADFALHGEISLLPRRARHLMGFYQIKNCAEFRAAIESGRLQWLSEWKVVSFENHRARLCTWNLWVILHEWAGLSLPTDVEG